MGFLRGIRVSMGISQGPFFCYDGKLWEAKREYEH